MLLMQLMQIYIDLSNQIYIELSNQSVQETNVKRKKIFEILFCVCVCCGGVVKVDYYILLVVYISKTMSKPMLMNKLNFSNDFVQDVRFYLDRRNGGAFKVKCVTWLNGQCRRHLVRASFYHS